MKKLKILVVLICFLFTSGCGEKEILSEEKSYENITYYQTNKKTNEVVINMEDDKKILMELYPDIAPKTVDNFKSLVDRNFYEGVIFHRVIKGFMIQTGDATSLGRNADTIKGEFSSNGFENNLKHERGVVSMARTNLKDSASSQFFIVHKDSPHLNGEYAGFGKVIAGIDVVDSIASVVTDKNDKPLKNVKIENIKFIKVVNKNDK